MRFERVYSIVFIVLFMAIVPFTIAEEDGECEVELESDTTPEFLEEIPEINSQLSSCTIRIPGAVNFLVGDGNVLVTVDMGSGDKENFYVTFGDKVLESVNSGVPSKYSYEILLSEETLDSILQSNGNLGPIMKALNDDKITIRGKGAWNKMKWFFGKFFVPKETNPGTHPGSSSSGGKNVEPRGKPINCDETYLPGHKDYAANKEKWDGYSSDTDKVCQSQYGKGIPNPCVHLVQLSVDGNPYYLCWYNE